MDLPWPRTELPVQLITNQRDKSPFIRLERLYHVRLQFIVNVKLVALHLDEAPQQYGRSSVGRWILQTSVDRRPSTRIPSPRPPPMPMLFKSTSSDNSFRVILSDDIEAGPGCCVHLTSAHFTCCVADEH